MKEPAYNFTWSADMFDWFKCEAINELKKKAPPTIGYLVNAELVMPGRFKK